MSGQIFISLMNPAICFFFAGIFAVLWRNLPNESHLLPAWIAFAYLGLGFITHDFRVLTPEGGINYAGNALIMLAIALACSSVLVRARTRVPVFAFAAVFILSGAMFLFASWVVPSHLLRIIAMSVGFVGFTSITLRLILASGISRYVDKMLAIGVSIAIVVAITRPALVLQGSLDINAEGDFRQSSYWETVRAFTPLISIAVAALFLWGVIADIMDRMRTEADTDYLTGLMNRRGFEQAAALVLQTSMPQDATPALLLADIDDFKKINDAFGHAVGDKVIASVGYVLSQSGETPIAGRIGGEEFALFYGSATREQLRDRARNIQRQLGQCRMAGLPADYPLTVSIGLHFRDRSETLNDMLSGADRALYRAKREGKNRAVISPALRQSEPAPPQAMPRSLSA